MKSGNISIESRNESCPLKPAKLSSLQSLKMSDGISIAGFVSSVLIVLGFNKEGLLAMLVKPFVIREVPTSLITAGDTVMIKGQPTPVSKKDIKKCPLMGTSIFGDSYPMGGDISDAKSSYQQG